MTLKLKSSVARPETKRKCIFTYSIYLSQLYLTLPSSSKRRWMWQCLKSACPKTPPLLNLFLGRAKTRWIQLLLIKVNSPQSSSRMASSPKTLSKYSNKSTVYNGLSISSIGGFSYRTEKKSLVISFESLLQASRLYKIWTTLLKLGGVSPSWKILFTISSTHTVYQPRSMSQHRAHP